MASINTLPVLKHVQRDSCSGRFAEPCRASSGYGGSRDSDGLQQASQVPEVIGDELPPTLLEVHAASFYSHPMHPAAALL